MPNRLARRLATRSCASCVRCSAGCKARLPQTPPGHPARSQELAVEVARTEAEREHGLMGRTDLGPRDGMIFVFDRDDHLSFWMKDTPTALSIAFLSADGKVLEIEDMEPFSEKIMRSRLSARYALEMRKERLPTLASAKGRIRSRRFPPRGFPQAGREHRRCGASSIQPARDAQSFSSSSSSGKAPGPVPHRGFSGSGSGSPRGAPPCSAPFPGTWRASCLPRRAPRLLPAGCFPRAAARQALRGAASLCSNPGAPFFDPPDDEGRGYCFSTACASSAVARHAARASLIDNISPRSTPCAEAGPLRSVRA